MNSPVFTISSDALSAAISRTEAVITSANEATFVRDPFVEEISVELEVNEPGPLLIIGAAALAIIAATGSTAAACKYMCSPKTVKSCKLDMWPFPKLDARCYN